MTINKSQGQTLKHVGLDLRGDVFCHQLYVAVSRTTSRNNILCLVRPERLLDGIPHVHNVVYPELIQAATGHPPPSFSDNRRKTNGQNTSSGNNEKSGSDDDTDSQKGNSDYEYDDFNDNDYVPQWHIMPELATVRVYYDAFQEEYTTRPICMSS